MKALRFFLLFCFGLLIWSCEVEPFEGNSLSETDPEVIDPDPEEEDPEEHELPPLNAGELRFVLKGRSFLTDRANSVLNNGITTIVGYDISNGEGLTVHLNGEGSGTYLFDSLNIATYSPSFVDRPYRTSVHHGEGTLSITDLDLPNAHMSGNFELIAYRETFDSEGNIVFDQNGNQIFDSVELGSGEFFMINIDQ